MFPLPVAPASFAGTGYLPDLFDFRDKTFGVSFADAALPATVAQFDLDFPIYDQGSDNSCVGFSYKEAAQVVIKKETGRLTALSAGFLWWLGRLALGWTGINSGCRIRDVIKGANTVGVPTEAVCPTVPGAFRVPPGTDAFEQAKDHPAFDYEVVDTVRAGRAACAHGFPIIFGSTLTDSFEAARRNGGFFPVPEGRPVSGHAMLIVGYDDEVRCPGWDERGAFRLRNHWGVGWGDRGWGWLPYAHFASPAVSDAWVLRRIRV